MRIIQGVFFIATLLSCGYGSISRESNYDDLVELVRIFYGTVCRMVTHDPGSMQKLGHLGNLSLLYDAFPSKFVESFRRYMEEFCSYTDPYEYRRVEHRNQINLFVGEESITQATPMKRHMGFYQKCPVFFNKPPKTITETEEDKEYLDSFSPFFWAWARKFCRATAKDVISEKYEEAGKTIDFLLSEVQARAEVQASEEVHSG